MLYFQNNLRKRKNFNSCGCTASGITFHTFCDITIIPLGSQGLLLPVVEALVCPTILYFLWKVSARNETKQNSPGALSRIYLKQVNGSSIIGELQGMLWTKFYLQILWDVLYNHIIILSDLQVTVYSLHLYSNGKNLSTSVQK